MFEEQNNASFPASVKTDNAMVPPKITEDIFAGVDKGNFNPLSGSNQNNPELIQSINSIAADAELGAATSGAGMNKKYIYILLGIIGVLAVVAVGTLLILTKIKSTNKSVPVAENPAAEVKKNNEIKTVTPPETLNNTENVSNLVSTTSNENKGTTTVPNSSIISAPIVTDTDQDGLVDAEEIKLGTNINSKDTDNDGLTDKEEVRIYGTDPLKADTDGDGYKDGEEVSKGYNPLGKGKLFDVTGKSSKISN
ncbi:MAG: hypothetical protein WCG01_02485 [bacterium]